MYRMSLSCVLLASAALGMIATDGLAATAQEQRQQKQAEIPRCARPLGNLAVEEKPDPCHLALIGVVRDRIADPHPIADRLAPPVAHGREPQNAQRRLVFPIADFRFRDR